MRVRLFALLLLLGAAAWFTGAPAVAAPASVEDVRGAAQSGEPVHLYFFWGDGCPHCAAEKVFLAELVQRFPRVQVHDFEVWYSQPNQDAMIRMAAKFGFEPTGVPLTVVGDRYWIGFAEDPIGKDIQATVAACILSGCPDAGAGVLTAAAPEPTAAPTPVAGGSASPAPAIVEPMPPVSEITPAPSPSQTLTLPLIGLVDLAPRSLAVSTALIAFVDGFNPCSLWVLSVLLGLTLHTGSRKKVFIIGIVFLTVTSLVYALFIAGLFTMFTFINFVGWIRLVVAAFALFFAAVNIKDYFWYKEGISFTIADDKKAGLYRDMRRVLKAGDSLPALIGATIVMAAGASLVEFSCTAGFPVLWTNLLVSQGVTALAFLALLLLYMLIYQLDEMAIFLVAVFSLRASKLEEKHGRLLKLAGGMLMLTLAAVMLINPNLMSDVGSALIVFGIAAGVTLLVLLLHRVVLPRFGVRIGSEFAVERVKRRDRRP